MSKGCESFVGDFSIRDEGKISELKVVLGSEEELIEVLAFEAFHCLGEIGLRWMSYWRYGVLQVGIRFRGGRGGCCC